MADIFAVIWHDFVPLHLKVADAETAIAKARDINARAIVADVHISDLRAVRLPDGADYLETLWEPPHA